MESGNTNDRQQLVTSLNRIIFMSVFVEVILLLLALYSFLRGGWFVLLGVILLLALGCAVGYMLFCLITAYAVKKAKTVEIHGPPPGKWGCGSLRLTFGKKYDPNHSDVD